MDINEPEEIKSAISGEAFSPEEGYITDAEGNHYRLDEYSIEVDKATNDEGNLPDEAE